MASLNKAQITIYIMGVRYVLIIFSRIAIFEASCRHDQFKQEWCNKRIDKVDLLIIPYTEKAKINQILVNILGILTISENDDEQR